jgi:hypothetical protein
MSSWRTFHEVVKLNETALAYVILCLLTLEQTMIECVRAFPWNTGFLDPCSLVAVLYYALYAKRWNRSIHSVISADW